MSVKVLHGDCVELMRQMPECSVDSIVTDPPYGLEFMAKDWDRPWAVSATNGVGYAGRDDLTLPSHRDSRNANCRTCGGRQRGAKRCSCDKPNWDRHPREDMVAFQVWFEDVAAEALRVLKPGGHLLAFGGTRTYHRMACAIEDAGFEIRDSIHWTYAVGFPKSLNVKKAAKDKACQCEQPLPYNYGRGDMLRMRDGVYDVSVSGEASDQPDVQPSVQREGSGPRVGQARAQGSRRVDGGIAPLIPVKDDGAEQSGVEGRGDLQASEGQLLGGEVRQVPGGPAADGPSGRLHHGAPSSDGSSSGSSAKQVRGGSPSESRPVGQQAGESGTVADERRPQARGGWPVCGGCGKPILTGWGTALKPAHEPIVVARKPLSGTVAGNVLAWGTGGLNIDGSRIGTDGGTRKEPSDDKSQTHSVGGYLNSKSASPIPAGRWPANIVLDGAAAAALDQQQEGADRYFTQADFGPDDWPFVYQAKPSRRERNAGLDGLPDVQSRNFAQDEWTMKNMPFGELPTKNHHPTVKPVALMRHLVRLVTPPGGTVLDPFAGSGTTLVAAVLEGFDAVGCEMTDEYLPIIQGRVAWAEEQVAARGPEQTTLL